MADDVFPTIINSADEVQTDASYAFENHRRNDSPLHVAIQRTLRGRAWFRDERGTHDVPAGRAMLFTHAEPTAYGFPPDATEPYRVRYISLTIGGLAPFFARLRADFGSVVNMPDESEATALFNELHTRFHACSFRDRLHESELTHHLLVALYREQVQETRTTDPIEFGHHFLHSYFRSPINLKLVAEKCGISREHFIREFTRRYHESPGSVLRRLRMEHARRMLRATRLPLQDIALACGYADANTFCRAHRLRYGKSPGAHRSSGPESPSRKSKIAPK